MTATDPQQAAMLAERLAPAATALATAWAEEKIAAPPPEDDRALTDHHRAGRAALSHLRQLLNVLDWAAARMPEPVPLPGCARRRGRSSMRGRLHARTGYSI